jgi:hypothetical protein
MLGSPPRLRLRQFLELFLHFQLGQNFFLSPLPLRIFVGVAKQTFGIAAVASVMLPKSPNLVIAFALNHERRNANLIPTLVPLYV